MSPSWKDLNQVERSQRSGKNHLLLGRDEARIYIDARLHVLRLSNRDLAKAAGVTDQYVNQVLSGKISVGEKIIEGLNRLDEEYEVLRPHLVVWKRSRKPKGTKRPADNYK